MTVGEFEQTSRVVPCLGLMERTEFCFPDTAPRDFPFLRCFSDTDVWSPGDGFPIGDPRITDDTMGFPSSFLRSTSSEMQELDVYMPKILAGQIV